MRDVAQDHGQAAMGIGFMPIGGMGNTAAPAAGTDGNMVRASFDRSGRLRILMDSGSSGGTVTVANTSIAVTPIANAQDTVVLVSSAVLAASSAWTGSAIVTLTGWRFINIDVYYTTDATGGTGGYMLWYPRVSNKAGAAPVFGDDVWVMPTLSNDTRTVTTPGGTIATGEDSTLAPGFAYTVQERAAFRSLAMANDTDVVRQRTTLVIGTAKYFSLAYQEAGDSSNPGTASIEYSLSL